MIGNIELASNEQFQHRMRRMNVIWLCVAITYTSVFDYGILSNEPTLFHDWRGLTSIALSLVIIGVYAHRVFYGGLEWPVPLRYALSIWLSLYLFISCMSLIDNNFCWLFYILFGIGFSLFEGRRLLLAVTVIALSLFAYQGLLTLPITSIQVISIVGQTVSIFAMTAIAMMSQRLIGDRYARNELLEKLTQSNRELEEAHRKLAESVEQEQELAVLRERTRLAREMHDTLGHALVLVTVKLEAAQRLRTVDPERCDRELEATKEIARETMKELRASIANLRSPTLERESVYCAISRYAQEIAERTGLHMTYELPSKEERLPEQVEETLWKVGQEALSNVEKHAQARNVVLHISRRDSNICLKIQDDGVGLPQALVTLHSDGSVATCSSPAGHYGLSGMCERVARSCGRIAFSSGGSVGTSNDTLPAHVGTTVEVELPLIEVL